MRPARSLHDLVARLDHRRRRYHRVRRLWGTGLGVLGGGLLLLGAWGTLPVSLRVSVPAGVRPAVVAPAVPAEGAGGPGISRGPWEGPPLLLASGVPLPHACDTRPPWQAPCPSGTGLAAASPTLRWPAPAQAHMPRALALAGQEPGALARPEALADPTPPLRPVRATPPAPPVAAASCGTSSCPAAPAGRRPPPVPARLTAGRRLPALRPAGLRPPVPLVPPQGLAATYSPPSLGEPERLLVSPPESAPLLLGP